MRTSSFIIFLFSSLGLFAQQNSFPIPSGDAEIKTGKLLIETNSWRESLLTFRDIHYSPYQVYNFQIESDGLKIKQDNSINYQFKSGGDFLVNNGKLGIGSYSPQDPLHITANSPWIRLEKPSSGFEQGLAFMQNSTPLFYFYTDNDGSNDLRIHNGSESASRIHLPYGNSNIYLAQSGGSVGINTNSPQAKLHINTNDWQSSLLTFSDTHYSPAQVYHFQIESDGLKIKQDANINYLFKSGGDFIVNNGTIHSKEIKVSLSPGQGPDYVFEKDYPLTSLSDLKTYIDQNKHLPEIPSAKEMEENGITLKEMNLLLLKKVEELTLYVIELKKENTLQDKKTKMLEEKLEKLKK